MHKTSAAGRGVRDDARDLPSESARGCRGPCAIARPGDQRRWGVARSGGVAGVARWAGRRHLPDGADDESVVDAQLRVRGVGGLRVVDVSVMPCL